MMLELTLDEGENGKPVCISTENIGYMYPYQTEDNPETNTCVWIKGMTRACYVREYYEDIKDRINGVSE